MSLIKELKQAQEQWKIRIQLGNWIGTVKVPKSQYPEAKAAHQAAFDKVKEMLIE